MPLKILANNKTDTTHVTVQIKHKIEAKKPIT